MRTLASPDHEAARNISCRGARGCALPELDELLAVGMGSHGPGAVWLSHLRAGTFDDDERMISAEGRVAGGDDSVEVPARLVIEANGHRVVWEIDAYSPDLAVEPRQVLEDLAADDHFYFRDAAEVPEPGEVQR